MNNPENLDIKDPVLAYAIRDQVGRDISSPRIKGIVEKYQSLLNDLYSLL